MSLEYKRISQSDVNAKKSCPYNWILGKKGVIGLPLDNQAGQFGLSVHRSIAEYYKRIPDKPRHVEIENCATKAFNDIVLSELPTLEKRCEKQLQNFIKFEKERLRTWKQFKPTLVEEKISDGYIVGVIDAYWELDQICVDWKTGGNSDITDNMIIQSAFYHTLLEYSNYKVLRTIFVMLSSGTHKDAPSTTKAFLEKTIDEFRNSKIVPIEGIHCNYCGFIIRCQLRNFTLWGLA